MAESVASSSYPKTSKLVQRLLQPNLSNEEKMKIQEQLLNISEKSLSPDQRQYLRNEIRRQRSSLERIEKHLPEQRSKMSPGMKQKNSKDQMKNSMLTQGTLADQNDEKYRQGFVDHMANLQNSCKKLTPDRQSNQEILIDMLKSR